MSDKNYNKTGSFKDQIPEDVREHMKTAHSEFRKSVEGILPPGFVEHRKAAHKEMLLALRGLLDHAIDRIDERTKDTE